MSQLVDAVLAGGSPEVQAYEGEIKKLQDEIEKLRKRIVEAHETRYGLRYASGEGFVALDAGSGGYPYAVALAEAQMWHTAKDRDGYRKIIGYGDAGKDAGKYIPVTIELTAKDET